MKKYESISPFLIKIEETTAGTKTGSATSMSEYYLYWEKRIFNCITTMLVKSMATFQTLFCNAASAAMNSGDTSSGGFADGSLTAKSAQDIFPLLFPPQSTPTTFCTPGGLPPPLKRQPLLKIKAQFNPPDVVLTTLHSVFKTITKLLQNILLSASGFTRWMEGTCRLVPPVPQSDMMDMDGTGGKSTEFSSFYRDIYMNPTLIDMTIGIQNNV